MGKGGVAKGQSVSSNNRSVENMLTNITCDARLEIGDE